MCIIIIDMVPQAQDFCIEATNQKPIESIQRPPQHTSAKVNKNNLPGPILLTPVAFSRYLLDIHFNKSKWFDSSSSPGYSNVIQSLLLQPIKLADF